MQPLEDRKMNLPQMTPPQERIVWEPWPRRVRAIFGGQTVADSTRAMLMIEGRRIAVYYFPIEDVRTDLLVPSDRRTRSETKGEGTYWSVAVGDRVAEDA